jgi:hypothetical protein
MALWRFFTTYLPVGSRSLGLVRRLIFVVAFGSFHQGLTTRRETTLDFLFIDGGGRSNGRRQGQTHALSFLLLRLQRLGALQRRVTTAGERHHLDFLTLCSIGLGLLWRAQYRAVLGWIFLSRREHSRREQKYQYGSCLSRGWATCNLGLPSMICLDRRIA